MKKPILAILLSLICANIYGEEISKIRLLIDGPRNIKSNGESEFELKVSNDENIVVQDLELSVINNDNIEISMDKTRIESLKPHDNIVIYFKIINNEKYYFEKITTVTIKISNNEFSKDVRFAFYIKPVEYFWLFIVLSIVLLITILFVILFIKLNKGEENVR